MDSTRVRCDAGTVVGWIDDDVLRFTGIRYASAVRFGRPEPQPPTDGDIDATRWSPRCPQRANPLQTNESERRELGVDEQCQFLSITTPRDIRPGESLPVMVWVHGGSYETGGGDETYSDPGLLVAEQRVVVVTLSYRLGPLGFLGGEGRPANLGLLDLLEGLAWVNRNLAAFGGDPGAVTLFGQSAGADAVAHLMISRGAEGLFSRAIIQSPPLGITLGRSRMAAVMSKRLGDLPATLTNEEMVRQQRPVVRGVERFGWVSAMPFGVQYGHDPVPAEEDLDEAWRQAATRVEVLIGSNNREAALFAEMSPVFSRLKGTRLGRRLYGMAVDWTTARVYERAITHFSERHSGAGGHVERYLLDWGAGPRFQGVHVIELALLFPTHAWEVGELLEGVALEEVRRQGRPMRDMWASFARTGRSGTSRIPGILHMV